jgi:uncharacterized protein
VTLLFGVMVASLVGSIHCVAMCGGFVCLYSTTGGAGRNTGSHLAYNGGRLVSYTMLGIAAGAVGSRVDRIAQLASFERGATILAGSLMIVWASALIATSLGVRLPRVSSPDWIKRRFGEALIAVRNQPAAVRAAATGLLTTLLPCGWLYTFVLTAGGTGTPLGGAAVMTVFWAGTVPMMLGAGFGVQHVARPIARHLPLASGVLVLALGALSLAGRLRPLAMPARAAAHQHAGHVGR